MKTKWVQPHSALSTAITKLRAKRRTKQPSKKFRKYVGECMQHPLIYQVESIVNHYNPPSKCKWYDYDLGDRTQNTYMLDQAWLNAEGYDVKDYNTGAAVGDVNLQRNFQCYIKKWKNSIHFTNIGTAQVNLTMFKLVPRFALGNTAVLAPDQAILQGEEDDLPTGQVSTNLMDPSDIRFTPYMCKQLITFWKIKAVKHYKIAAGQSVTVIHEKKDYKLTNQLDSYHHSLSFGYRPGKCEVLLFKQWGIEGTDAATSTELRTIEGTLRTRFDCTVEFNRVPDIRPVVFRPSAAFVADTASKFVDPQEAIVATYNTA